MVKINQSKEQILKNVISLIITSGFQLDPEALTYLKTISEGIAIEELVKKCINKLSKLADKPLFLTEEILKQEVGTIKKNEKKTKRIGIKKTFQPHSKNIDKKIEILDNPDNLASNGKLEDFLDYFRDRYNKIERIFRQRFDTQNVIPINLALDKQDKSNFKIIGLVTEKRTIRKNIFLRLEDFNSSATVLVPFSLDRGVFEKAQRILLDQIICIECVKGNKDLLIARNILNPDIPEKKYRFSPDPVFVALLSDLHIGSREFMDRAFNSFTKWLLGSKGNNRQKDIAEKIKYIIIAGDIVDGIGIYPNQEEDLVISDIYEQYQMAAKLLKRIPDYIEIIVIPGNHDAARQALPQPAIQKKYAEPLYELENVLMLGNPSRVSIHGVNFLLYHGRSLDDIIGVIPEITYQNLISDVSSAMKQLLKIRHLAPTYNGKTSIAPLFFDSLVIDSPPDVFHSGHVHVMGYEIYRGTLMVNSGAWQNQTEFQKKMGLIPTPGIVPIVDLQTYNIMPLNFIDN